MQLGVVKRQARESLRGKWGIAVLLTFIVFIITLIVPVIVEIIMSGGLGTWLVQEEPPLLADIFHIVFSFAIIPFSMAIYWFFLDNYRGENPTISRVFTVYKDGKMSFKLIGTSVIVGIFTFLWSILLIIPGIIKGLAYSQFFFLLKDHPEYGMLEAIKESQKRMKGYKWKLFLLYLSFIGWGILCLFTLGIGFLWLFPYISASLAAFYQEYIYAPHESDNETHE